MSDWLMIRYNINQLGILAFRWESARITWEVVIHLSGAFTMTANVKPKRNQTPNTNEKFAFCCNEVHLSKSMRSVRYVSS